MPANALTFGLDHDVDRLAVRLSRASEMTLQEVRTIARSAMGVFVEYAKDEAPRGKQHRGGATLASSLGYATKLTPKGIELRHRSGGASGAGVPYARFVADGTGIYHRPDPHSAWDVDKYQRFHLAADGTEIRTMHTHHEGQRPNDFELRAMRRLMVVMPAIVATGGRRLVRWIGTGHE